MVFSTSESDLKPFLLGLGLEKYFTMLMEEDIDSVGTLQSIPDNDLRSIGVKCGAIAKI